MSATGMISARACVVASRAKAAAAARMPGNERLRRRWRASTSKPPDMRGKSCRAPRRIGRSNGREGSFVSEAQQALCVSPSLHVTDDRKDRIGYQRREWKRMSLENIGPDHFFDFGARIGLGLEADRQEMRHNVVIGFAGGCRREDAEETRLQALEGRAEFFTKLSCQGLQRRLARLDLAARQHE